MTRTLEFFFDFRSPYSYLALTQLVQMDVSIGLRPMKVLDVMEIVGNVPTTLTCAAKGRYARADLGRWAQRYGIAINPSDMRANDGAACSRAILSADGPAEALAATLALFRAMWSEKYALTNTADVLEALARSGIATTSIATRIDSLEIAERLDANTKEAAERGVFGAPTMFVADTMYFGNDRLDFAREHLARLEKAA